LRRDIALYLTVSNCAFGLNVLRDFHLAWRIANLCEIRSLQCLTAGFCVAAVGFIGGELTVAWSAPNITITTKLTALISMVLALQ
jgi:hypothetical protein